MPLLLERRIKLHPVQAAFRRSASLYRGFVGGIGSGKSWVGAYDLVRRARRGRTYMAVAPTYTMLSDSTLRSFLAIAYELGLIGEGDVKRAPPAVRLSTGAEILFRSADNPDRLRGPNLSGVWMDEASLTDTEAYEVLIGRLRERGEQGWLSATFTPKGLSHWTYEVFGRQSPDTDLFHARTDQNPFNPPTFSGTLARQYSPQLARQELGGEFVDLEGAEWPVSCFEGPGLWFASWPESLTLRVMALDPSKGKDSRHGDYSAFVLMGLDHRGHLWVEADLARRPTTQIVADGITLAARFETETRAALDGFGVEANAFQELLADEIIKQSRAQRGTMLPVYKITNSTNKVVRIRKLTPHLMARDIHFRDTSGTRLLVQQMRDFPVGDHDDGPDALEMARRLVIDLWGRKKRKKR